ncbi:hypothetical protein C5167_025189 [Papaver somniferum]|uniref:Uncharacterized protein n=1 Tax=Papaver somniferum TaxID=3469 RepID=A0A4Y7JUF1_PAPSO|nr:hypothetical protein C5167_025189 [Papaver somniferum]
MITSKEGEGNSGIMGIKFYEDEKKRFLEDELVSEEEEEEEEKRGKRRWMFYISRGISQSDLLSNSQYPLLLGCCKTRPVNNPDSLLAQLSVAGSSWF